MNISNLELKIVIGVTVLIFVSLVTVVFLGFKQESTTIENANVDIYSKETVKNNLSNVTNDVTNNTTSEETNTKTIDELNLEVVQSAVDVKIAKIKLETKTEIVITPGEIKAKDLGSAEFKSGATKGAISFESIGLIKTTDYKGIWLIDANGKVSLK